MRYVPSSIHSTNLKYRADIDGLRAIAVLSVVLFHINASWVPNGFLGVDIFFVISGYLITSIVYRDISQDTFSYSEFYLRRIRRILPVFFSVIFFSLIVGSFLIATDLGYSDFLRSTFYSSIFAANVYFMRGGGYFSPEVETKPLLHIWSLSIEEQFYFIFPLFLILILKYNRIRKYKYAILFGLLGVTLALSFIDLGLLGFSWDPYYMPHLRVPEMLVGSILAIVLSDKKIDIPPGKTGLYSILCILTLLLCFWAPPIFKASLFPGILALVPCSAAAGLLYFNVSRNIITGILSLPPVVWIGKISYSLYLWHWVVLAFLHEVYGLGVFSPSITIFAMATMLLLAILSYYFIEQPTRHMAMSFQKAGLVFYVIPVIIICLYIGLYNAEVVPRYQIDKSYTTIDVGKALYGTIEGDGRVGDLRKPTNILIIGDSHTAHLGRFFDIVGKKEGWSAFVTAAAAGPFYFDDHVVKDRWVNTGGYISFIKKRNSWMRHKYQKYDIIVYPIYWGAERYQDSDFIPVLDRTINRFLQEGKSLILMNSFAKVQNTGHAIYKLKKIGVDLDLESVNLRGQIFQERMQVVDSIRMHVAEKYPQVRWVELTPYIPASLFVNGKPIVADNEHLNGPGVEWLAKQFMKNDRLIK